MNVYRNEPIVLSRASTHPSNRLKETSSFRYFSGIALPYLVVSPPSVSGVFLELENYCEYCQGVWDTSHAKSSQKSSVNRIQELPTV